VENRVVADNLTKEQRSYAMSQIRSRGNSSTEQALIATMRGAGLSGWRRKSLLCGKPDFVFPRFRTVVFVDGCYWHGCPKCGLASKSNTGYWMPKIEGNRNRDKANTRQLRKNGWTVVRIWEHELKIGPMKCLKKILSAIRRYEH
jgi:DNA mismatch endonuclease (patch repair protein)